MSSPPGFVPQTTGIHSYDKEALSLVDVTSIPSFDLIRAMEGEFMQLLQERAPTAKKDEKCFSNCSTPVRSLSSPSSVAGIHEWEPFTSKSILVTWN